MSHTRQPSPEEINKVEVQVLLEAIYQGYGFDFRQYAYPSIKRRIQNFMEAEKLSRLAELQDRILHDRDSMERLLLNFSVTTTSMFRDPGFFLAFRRQIVPWLRTFPFIRIWHAGCSTGEEVYSMAILLREEGLYHKARLYGTDFNEVLLQRAKDGISHLERMQEYTQNYQQAGGKKSFSEYYVAKYGKARLNPELAENLVFAQHNLVTDASFNEFTVILCRNVMIYFNRDLQNRVHRLLYDSLGRLGVLGVGDKESLRFTPYEACYETLDAEHKLYRKIK